MLALRRPTAQSWVAAVLADVPAFLADHAACERKASATGMAFVVRYPDRAELLDPMIAFAREELEHFHRVHQLMAARGVSHAPDVPDLYLKGLLQEVRHGRDERLLDRLLVAGVVEARGCERFRLVGAHVEDAELAEFYAELARAEARHQGLFVRLARCYFSESEVASRLDALLEREAEVMAGLPIRAALH